MSCNNVPGGRKGDDPIVALGECATGALSPNSAIRGVAKQPGDHYSDDSYRRAITRACAKAGVEPWTPHRLRHSAATQVRREFGLDSAQSMLGHRNAAITELYAELDVAKASEVAAKIG